MWSNLNLEPGPSGPQPNAGYTRQSQILAKLLNPLTLWCVANYNIMQPVVKMLLYKAYSKHTAMEIKAHFCIVIFIKWFRLINTPCRPRADAFVSPPLSIIAQPYFYYHCIVWVPWESGPGSPCQSSSSRSDVPRLALCWFCIGRNHEPCMGIKIVWWQSYWLMAVLQDLECWAETVLWCMYAKWKCRFSLQRRSRYLPQD